MNQASFLLNLQSNLSGVILKAVLRGTIGHRPIARPAYCSRCILLPLHIAPACISLPLAYRPCCISLLLHNTLAAFSKSFTPKKDSCVRDKHRSNHAWSFSAFVHSNAFLGRCMTNGDYPGIVFLLPNPSTAPENNSGPGAVNWRSHTFGLISSRRREALAIGGGWFELNVTRYIWSWKSWYNTYFKLFNHFYNQS